MPFSNPYPKPSPKAPHLVGSWEVLSDPRRIVPSSPRLRVRSFSTGLRNQRSNLKSTAAGGLGILFVSAIPAMYALGLFSDSPTRDAGKLVALTVTAGFFGVFFVIPLRRYYIIKQKLTFPTPAATAFTIRALHNGTHGAVTAAKKTKGLICSLVGAFLFKVVGIYAPGITFDWHIGWTLYRLGFTSIIALENYGWILEFTPAFFGAGMLSGLNASWSFRESLSRTIFHLKVSDITSQSAGPSWPGGSVSNGDRGFFFFCVLTLWPPVAPSLIATGKAVSTPISEEFPLFSVASLSFKDPEAFLENPSPRYWLLWPGVLIMLLYSFTDIFITVTPPLIGKHPRFWTSGSRNSNLAS